MNDKSVTAKISLGHIDRSNTAIYANVIMWCLLFTAYWEYPHNTNRNQLVFFSVGISSLFPKLVINCFCLCYGSFFKNLITNLCGNHGTNNMLRKVMIYWTYRRRSVWGYCSIQDNKDNKKGCIPENVQKLKTYNDDLSLIGFFLGFVCVNLLNMAFQISDVMHFIVL